MSSKVKICHQLASIFRRSLCDAFQISRPFSVTLSRHYASFDNSRVPIHPPLFGASLQSLPGSTHLVIPASSVFVRTKRMLADNKISWNLGALGIKQVEDITPISDEQLQQAITYQINDTLENGREGRLYAVVNIRSLQYKVTAGDIIIVKHDFPPNVGDKLRLEKVLAVGGSDFTLYGQPLLSRDRVLVEATVVERTQSHNRVWFMYKKRENWKRFHLYRERQTMLLINSVRVASLGDQTSIEDGKKTSSEE